MNQPTTYYVYILECNDGSFYTGITNNLAQRLKIHRAGKGSKYVRAKLPVRLVYKEIYPNKASASRREYELKQLSHQQKLQLFPLTNKDSG